MKKDGLQLAVEEIKSAPKIKKIVDSYFPGVIDRAGTNTVANKMSLAQILAILKLDQNKNKINKLETDLQPFLTSAYRRKMYYKQIAFYHKLEKQRLQRQKTKRIIPKQKRYRSFRPGQVWLDTQGEPIQAHGGGLIFTESKYYWYGEDKEFTDCSNNIWTWGIRLYSSSDLYNWNDEGLIIEPVLDDPDSDLFPSKGVDRPHIVRRSDGKYICWLKLTGNDACFTVFMADSIKGPYKQIVRDYRPFGIEIGDFDLILNKQGQGWLFVTDARVGEGVKTLKLNKQLTQATKDVCRQYTQQKGSLRREGIVVFERKDKKYMLTSGMTNYVPNEADSAESSSWSQSFISIGDPCVGDLTLTTFNSQPSEVFKIPGHEKYLVMADRWLGDKLISRKESLLIRKVMGGDPMVSAKERQEVINGPAAGQPTATKFGRYVWLPLEFDKENGHPYIKWQKEWQI